jgi:four helix bundle protein
MNLDDSKEQKSKKYDLEERLIDFAINVIDMTESLPSSKSCNHIGGQILRSGTAPAFNYGEAQSAESRNDFIHKMKICLKELRETNVGVKILERKNYCRNSELVSSTKTECNELISIFAKSINTAKVNNVRKN